MHRDRLPPLPEDQWTQVQREAAQEVIRGPRGALISPFVPMLRSPELMTHAQRMGEYLRYRSALGLRLSELAILLVARSWSQQVEWAIHVPIAEREGILPSTIEAIAEGRRPEELNAQESVLYEFWLELETHRSVSDRTWTRAIAEFGEQGTVDLIGVLGYYAFLAMTMNAARTEVPQTNALPLPRLVGKGG